MEDIRREYGQRSILVLRPDDDPNSVVLLGEWDTLANARRFFSSPELRAAMDRGGVVGRPEILYLQEEPSIAGKSTHPFVHIELSTNDREASGKFYSNLFGWQVQQLPEMNYATFTTGEGVGGGFSPITDNNPAGTVIVHVATDDIPATLTRVQSLGGKTVIPETEIPEMGWFAIFRDPTGNLVGLFKALPR
jgi:predicted enzyme related to lactoylglutathione lyase